MATTRRLYDRGTTIGEKRLREFGEECKHQRLRLGVPQKAVADAARIDRGLYSRIERGKVPYLSILLAARIAAVLGLDLVIKAYPGASSIRDAGQAPRLARLVGCIGAPLRYRLEAPLPPREGSFEQRAWDCEITGSDKRTVAELEAALYDIQAQRRRHGLKLRDDPPDSFLLVVADTRTNRRVLAANADLFADLPRLRTGTVLKMLRAGQHPPTGLILL